jgi:hypothetical protein
VFLKLGKLLSLVPASSKVTLDSVHNRLLFFVCPFYSEENRSRLMRWPCCLCISTLNFLMNELNLWNREYIRQLNSSHWSVYMYVYPRIIARQRLGRNIKKSYLRNRPWRPTGLWDVKDPTLSRSAVANWRLDLLRQHTHIHFYRFRLQLGICPVAMLHKQWTIRKQ